MESKKRYALIGTGAVVLLSGTAAIVGPGIYANMQEANNAAAPSITMSAPASSQATDATSADASKPVLAGSWQVADGSEAGYRVNEVLNGQDVTVTGRTSDVTGNFTVSEHGTTLETATFTVDLSTVATDSDRRDKYFKNTTIDTNTYPTAELTITEPVNLGEAAKSGETKTVEVTGQLTIKGQTQTVTFPLDVAGNGEQVQIAASLPISFADYGIEAPSLGFVSVEDKGSIEVQLTATPAA
ncbi:MAG: YceI family protein [Rothia sp. (in: high G+C Gram-positive bacteria)]|nr:YceI family protein [Rothia sp. (in: high G+C Gram-positive bacteria)]